MRLSFLPVLLVAVIGAAFVFLMLLVSFILRPNTPDPTKSDIYECGEPPIGSAWVNTNIRFYIIALIFLIFEVEVAFMFPVAVVFKKWSLGQGGMSSGSALVAVLIFAGTLFVGVIYSWVKGDFEWVQLVAKTKTSGEGANVLPVNLRPETFSKKTA